MIYVNRDYSIKILDMKQLLLLLLALFLSLVACAQAAESVVVASNQEKQSMNRKDKIYYGGNIGLSFGSYTMIAVRPLLGYKFTPKLSGGIKLSYEYVKDTRYSSSYKTSNYGGSLFSRYRIIPPLYLHAEYASINYQLHNLNGESNREWVPFLLMGAGYSQKVGSNSWLNFQILFDVLQSDKSPYKSSEPFYSVGIGVGF